MTQQQDPPAAPPVDPPAVERPQWMEEKFWDGNLESSAKKQADSYRELQKKLGAPKPPLSIDPPPPAIDDDAGLDAVISKAGFTREDLAKTVSEAGDLTAEQYAAFKALGYGKKIVQDTIRGIAVAEQQAVDRAVAECKDLAGGEAQLQTLLTFAAQLPASVQEDLNRRLGNSATMKGAVLEIQGHYAIATKQGKAPPLIEGGPASGSSAKPYATQSEFMAGAKDKTADGKALHYQRLAATKNLNALPLR